MSGWPLLTLGEVFDIARGGSPRPIDDFITEDPAGINWILIGDASEGSKYITGTKKRIRPEGAQRSRAVKPGDFLLTNSMSFGKPYIMRTSGCIHDGWLVLSPRRGDVDADFYYHLLSSNAVYSEFERRAAGATVKNLNIDLVRGVKIPLPPLPEQRRIAEILDKADALRAKRRAALVRLDTLTQSIFLDMFGENLDAPAVDTRAHRATIPKGCSWVLLTDVARLATGHTPDRERPEYWNGDIPWISLTDIRSLDGTEATSTLQTVTPLGIENSSSVLLPQGTVCFSRTASVGFVTVMGRAMATSQDFMNWVCGPLLDPVYLMWALITSRQRLLSLAPGSTHRTIYMRVVEQFRVLLPPIQSQRQFARRVASIDEMKKSLHASLAELDCLFVSLQHRAFRGEL
jgi:type I restriction enzyme S subunit